MGAGLKFGASSAGRAAISSGASGATANLGNYHLNDPGEKTVAGTLGSLGTGFATGSLFSYGGGKIATLASSKLAPAAQSTGRHVLAPVHAAAPNVATFNNFTNIGADHTVGMIQGGVNQLIRPGAETDFKESVAPAAGLNFILGSKGMTAAGH
ncbi:hypothetical protein [Arthrobacter polaris]|uniref:hypothetical protein n=1 Tax=Arthrobacter polaris TaxID=2813727 RepID=UPI001F26EF59|nr:hypothetical protein [Arthrobacter polaris]UIK87989.1 hypothetical protein J0916_11015 [Arthrobacter polaris]